MLSESGSQPISRVLSAACAAVTVIPLDVRLPARSSHLPASSAGRVNACLLGVAPGGGCRAARVTAHAVRSYRTVSPLPDQEMPVSGHSAAIGGLFSVALFLASRRTVVSRHPTLWSPDFPLAERVIVPTATAWPTPGAILTRAASHLPRSSAPVALNRKRVVKPSSHGVFHHPQRGQS